MTGSTPKVLFDLGGQPILRHVLNAVEGIETDSIHIVVGHQAEQVRRLVPHREAQWHKQSEQLGTAHAVACALPSLDDDTAVLVTYGDMPLLRAGTYLEVTAAMQDFEFVVLTAKVERPDGYGRILRDRNGELCRIIEHADATHPQRRALKEVNVGVIAARAALLRELINRVGNENKQKEYYLTDCLEAAAAGGVNIGAVRLYDADEACGINTPVEFERAERLLQERRVYELGQTAILKDASRIDVRGEVTVGRGVVFDIGVILEGQVVIGDDVRVGPYTIIKDAAIANGTRVEPFSHIEDAQIGRNCRIGPYARVRPDTVVKDDVCIGNFVEVKKSRIDDGSKINHLSYIGDSDVGKKVNVGAGTITCNYDGARKHKTVIGDEVFIGSDTQIIAPVTIGSGATIGAGSTIVRDAKAGELTLSRSAQKTVKNWRRPRKA